jgi:hypothetical protein
MMVGACLASAAEDDEADRWATLEAIHSLENPRDLTRPGPKGELGAYQFRETTWRAYTTEPFEQAVDRSRSDFVANRHYDWLKGRLEQAHLPVTTYNVALAWNAGLGAVVSGRASRSARDYAQRAVNLATLRQKSAAVASAR